MNARINIQISCVIHQKRLKREAEEARASCSRFFNKIKGVQSSRIRIERLALGHGATRTFLQNRSFISIWVPRPTYSPQLDLNPTIHHIRLEWGLEIRLWMKKYEYSFTNFRKSQIQAGQAVHRPRPCATQYCD